MNTSVQLKINLSPELQSLLRAKANSVGVPLTQYVKHVLINDVEKEDYPEFEASDATVKAAKKAMKELDKAVDAKTFFKQLHK